MFKLYNINLKKLIKIALILLIINNAYGQDPYFSQFYASPLYLAPSFAGAGSENTRVSLNYRNQWPEVGAFSTYSFSADHFLPKIKSGVGFLMLRDNAGFGSLTRTNIGTMYSFDFKITEDHHIRPGVNFMYTWSSVDFSKLEFYDMIRYDKNTTNVPHPTNPIKGDIDFSTSVIGYGQDYWGGFIVDHLLTPNQTFYGLNSPVPMKYSVFGGYKYKIRERLIRKHEESLTFAFIYKRQANYQQLDIGTYYHKNPLVFGVWYRGIPFIRERISGEGLNAPAPNPGNDAIVFLVGYKLEDINIGYSFDITVSNMKTYTGGAHEISFIWNFKMKEWDRKPQAIPCPHF